MTEPDPTRVLDLLWGASARPSRSGLGVASITEQAVRLADDRGLAAVTMRTVAGRLGVGTMSLYTHVPGKPELLELMLDRVLGTVHPPDDRPADQPDWRDAVRLIARRNWDLHLAHPWTLEADPGSRAVGPNLLAKYEAELRPLDRIGLTDLEMDLSLSLVLGHVSSAARWRLGLTGVRERSGQSDTEWWTQVSPALQKVMQPGRFDLAQRVGTAAGLAYDATADPEQVLEFGVARIIDGISAHIAGG